MNIKDIILEIIYSIIPLTIFIFILLLLFIDISIKSIIIFVIGVLMATIGFILFVIGANVSLLPLGKKIGQSLITKTSLWFVIGLIVALGFALTVAEPAVLVFAPQTDIVINGIVPSYLLIIVMALGVGIFLGLALLRFIFNISLKTLLISCYIFIFIFSYLAPYQFFTIAFDSGGVTTGPIISPFLLALGLGLTSIKGIAKGTEESFGFVALASIGTILAVLILGVIIG